jgi:hypothetical protein
MVEHDACAALVTWLHQARDYMVRPPDWMLAPGASFTARVRHVIATVENAVDLAALWEAFEDEAAGRARGA